MPDPVTITGTLVNLRFHNANNGFTICQIQTGKNIVTCKGTILNPEVNVEYKLTGSWIDDAKWGKQFVIKMYEVKQPTDVDGIYRYLVKIARWVGPKIGLAMVQAYGDQTLEILKTDPERVDREIKGITLERALEIQKNLINNAAMEQTLVALEGMLGANGIFRNAIVAVVKKWSGDAPAMIRGNPYILTQINGIGFLSADRVSMALGFDPKSPLRQKEAILHVLKEKIFGEGHTWIKTSDVIDQVMGLIGYRVENAILSELVESKLIVQSAGMLSTRATWQDEIVSAAALWNMVVQYNNLQKEVCDV